jgi:hypothetical protein
VTEPVSCELAVFGSTPLAGFLAGLLAFRHRRSVCLVAHPRSPFRLPRRVELSLSPVTRPETLRLLLKSGRETVGLLRDLGKGLVRRIDPVVIAETAASAAAMGHFRHLAAALGVAVEPQADKALPEATMLRIRDVAQLVPDAFEAALAPWLDAAGVTRLDASTATVSFRRDGGARLESPGGIVVATRTILADDAAVLALAPKAAEGRLLRTRPATVVVTEPFRLPRDPLTIWVDRDLVLVQRREDGVMALIGGDPATARERLGASLRPAEPLRRAGESRFATLATTDGAPLFGRPPGSPAELIAGFGATALFLAPAIARVIAGASGGAELAWFTAHGPSRSASRPGVADYPAFAA